LGKIKEKEEDLVCVVELPELGNMADPVKVVDNDPGVGSREYRRKDGICRTPFYLKIYIIYVLRSHIHILL
jgi:hypothetical protein